MRRGDPLRRAAVGVWLAAAAVCAAAMAVSVLGLARGRAGDRIAVLLLMLGLMALALGLVWREYRDLRCVLWLALPVATAFLARALCLDHASYDYLDFLSRWASIFRQNGGFRAVALEVGDYNAPYLYFVAAISYFNFPDLYAYKLLSMLFDVLLAWGGLRLTIVLRSRGGERHGGLAPLAAFGLTLLLPTVVLNGSCWAQCDAIYGALVVHALALVLESRPKSSLALLAVAFSFKLQTVFILPLWGILWLARRVKLRELLVFPGVYFLTILPAMLLGKPMRDILGVYFDQMGEYTDLTFNAPTVFQFVPYGVEVNDKLLSRLGIAAAFALVLGLLAVGFALRGRLDNRTVLLMAVVLVIGIPFFLPRMHERYFFLADALTLCWACADRKKGIPVCILAAGSSLLSYLVYLRLKFNVIVSIEGAMFVMLAETLMMLGALLLTVRELFRQINTCKGNYFDGGEAYEAGVLECERPAGVPEEGISGVDAGAGPGCDLPPGDEDGVGPGGA